jgi:hypothetical protein
MEVPISGELGCQPQPGAELYRLRKASAGRCRLTAYIVAPIVDVDQRMDARSLMQQERAQDLDLQCCHSVSRHVTCDTDTAAKTRRKRLPAAWSASQWRGERGTPASNRAPVEIGSDTRSLGAAPAPARITIHTAATSWQSCGFLPHPCRLRTRGAQLIRMECAPLH